MAVIGSTDGSIVLKTQVDTTGIEQGNKNLKSQAAKLAAEYRKAGLSQSEAMKKAWEEVNRTKVATEGATKSTKNFGDQSQKSGKKAKNSFSEVSTSIKNLASAIAVAFSVSKIIQFSKEASDLAIKTEASVRRLVDIYGAANKEVSDFIEQNALSLGIAKSAASEFASVYGNLFSVWADQATNARLTTHYLNMTSVVASKTGRTMEDVQERIRSGLLGNTEAVEDLGIFVNVKTIEMTNAFQRMANGRSWEQLNAYEQQQVRALAILEQATDKYGSKVEDTTSLTQARYRAAWQDFKATWGQVVNKILMPIMEWLTTVLLYATRALQVLFNISDEKPQTKWWETAKATAEANKNQNKLNDEIKDTEKAMKGALAGFDELNVIAKETADTNIADNLNTALELEPVESIIDEETMRKLDEFEAWMREHRDEVILGAEILGVTLLSSKLIGLGKNIGNILGWFRKKDSGLRRQTRYTKRETSAVADLAYAFGLVPNGNLLPWLNDIGAFGSNIIPGLILAGDAVWAFGELWDGLTATTTSNAAAINANVSNLGVGIVNAMASASGQVAGYTQTMLGTITDFVADANMAWSNFWAGSTPANNSTSSAVGTVSSVVGAAADATSAAVSAAHTRRLLNKMGDWSNPASKQSGGDVILDFFDSVFDGVGDVIGGAADIVEAVVDPVAKVMSGLLKLPAETAEAAVKVVEGTGKAVEYVWDATVVPLWNNYGKEITVGLLGGTLIAASAVFGGKAGVKWATSLVGLANGTVVPPNNPYLAMLGDNKREPEIVSPLSTMKQAVSEVLASGNYGGAQTVIVQIDGREVARAVRTANGQMGNQTVYGGFANAY